MSPWTHAVPEVDYSMPTCGPLVAPPGVSPAILSKPADPIAEMAVEFELVHVTDGGDRRCGRADCYERAIARSRLHQPGLQWCLPHFVDKIARRAIHEAARLEHEEVDLLVGHIHATYHQLADTVAALEAVGARFPECSTMPLHVGDDQS